MAARATRGFAFRRTFATLDLAAERVSLALFKLRGSDACELGYVRSRPMDWGSGANKEAYRELALFLREQRGVLRGANSISVTLPAHVALTKTISTPVVPINKRAKIVEFEASQAIPFPLEDVCWDWHVMAENTDGLEVGVMAIKADVMRSVLAAATEAGLTVRRAIPASLALREAFRRVHGDFASPGLIVCIDSSATQLVFVCGKRYAARSLALSWTAAGSGVSGDSNSVNGFARRLGSEIARSLVHFQQAFSPETAVQIYLTGSGPQVELTTALSTALEREVHRFDPLENFALSPVCREQISSAEICAMTALIGATAFVGLTPDEGPNLLPPRERCYQAFQRRQPSLVFASLLAPLALVPPLVHLRGEQRALNDALRSRETEMRDLQAARQRATAAAERARTAVQSAERFEQIERTRAAWVEFLADLERRVTTSGDIWIEQLMAIPSTSASPAASRGKENVALELEIAGQMIERSGDTKLGTARPQAADQLRHLLASLRASPFVTAIHDERFEPSGPGALRFAVIVTLNQQNAL